MGWECQNCHSFFTRGSLAYIYTSWSCKSGSQEVPWGNADPRIIEQLFAAAGAGMSPFEQGRLQLSEERKLWPLEVFVWRDAVLGELWLPFAVFVFFSFLRLWAPRRRRSKPKPEKKKLLNIRKRSHMPDLKESKSYPYLSHNLRLAHLTQEASCKKYSSKSLFDMMGLSRNIGDHSVEALSVHTRINLILQLYTHASGLRVKDGKPSDVFKHWGPHFNVSEQESADPGKKEAPGSLGRGVILLVVWCSHCKSLEFFAWSLNGREDACLHCVQTCINMIFGQSDNREID